VAETAVVVPVALPTLLARLREPEVEVARLGVPPHVTILSPFLDSAAIDAVVHERLAAIARGEPAFDVAFRSVRRWPPSADGPGVVWLAPDPAEPFVRLTRAVWAAWPETPPYGRADDDLEPHLTIAIDEPSRFDAVEAEAARWLPFDREVRLMALLTEGADGRWSEAGTYPLGRSG
jgi:2'-5' RNA ligase